MLPLLCCPRCASRHAPTLPLLCCPRCAGRTGGHRPVRDSDWRIGGSRAKAESILGQVRGRPTDADADADADAEQGGDGTA